VTGETVTRETVLRFADIVLDEGAHEVRRSGQAVDLTPTEFRLLRFFLLSPQRVHTREQILESVWGGSRVELGEVETYVSYLRRKLDPHGPPLIQTIRSFGYALRSPS
jgi:two-component system OmpR family response regulator